MIHDPYAGAGTYRKAQLHTHTTASDGKISPEDLLGLYREAGYTFVALTDHDRVTRCTRFDGSDFLAVPGEENTVVRLFWPLGQHLLRLFATEHLVRGSAQERMDLSRQAGVLTALSHPGWVGNLGTGQWRPTCISRLRGFNFVEIFNHFSDPAVDMGRWYEALRGRGPEEPVWALAVDDTHRREDVNRAWVMVKVPEVSLAALHRALEAGSFYASTGPEAVFGVREGSVFARAAEEAGIRFYDGENRLVYEVRGREAGYTPAGGENFIRVEVDGQGGTAWSQPFWCSGKG